MKQTEVDHGTSSMSTSKQIAIVFRQPPYGSSFAREALDTAMAAAAFDQKVSLVFIGDGVWQLLANQQPQAIGQRSLEKQLATLPLYDVDRLYADAAALSQRGLHTGDLSLPVEVLDSDAIATLLRQQDVVLSF